MNFPVSQLFCFTHSLVICNIFSLTFLSSCFSLYYFSLGLLNIWHDGNPLLARSLIFLGLDIFLFYFIIWIFSPSYSLHLTLFFISFRCSTLWLDNHILYFTKCSFDISRTHLAPYIINTILLSIDEVPLQRPFKVTWKKSLYIFQNVIILQNVIVLLGIKYYAQIHFSLKLYGLCFTSS